MTLKSLKQEALRLDAIALDNKSFEEIKKLKDLEKGFETVDVAFGRYGIAGGIARGNTSKKFYSVLTRSSALLQIF